MRIDKIIWNEDFIFGIGVIDYQHKRIIDLINDIAEHIHDEKSMEDIIFLIDELLESVLIHLETEEEVLRMVNYPNSNVHKDIHENYLKNIQKIYNDASVKDIHKLIIYLKEWWINHILNEDKEYKDYVLSKGYK